MAEKKNSYIIYYIRREFFVMEFFVKIALEKLFWKKSKKIQKKVLTNGELFDIIVGRLAREQDAIDHWKLNNTKFWALKSAEISLKHFEKKELKQSKKKLRQI